MEYSNQFPSQNYCHVALTFDDGPSLKNTPGILVTLRKYEVPATFFVNGNKVENLESIAADGITPEASTAQHIITEIRANHEVGNHSWDHPDLAKLGKKIGNQAVIEKQITPTQEVIRRVYGEHTTRSLLFRPPFGNLSLGQANEIKRKTGMTTILWDIDTEDYNKEKGASAATITEKVNRYLTSHSQIQGQQGRDIVILMHDGVTNSPETVQALPKIIRAIRNKGCQIVPLGKIKLNSHNS
ncbi:polysaccharide deacetylase family protein [Pasteuria penetrans]|uniref:polysaccharide deacetylase family protein n=1 Tax=Pasteuria penetrans TaxID=86005 RepID=UPI00165C86FD|nr:polysaccharide deacetylase family protein [Pasteuria penetrans]